MAVSRALPRSPRMALLALLLLAAACAAAAQPVTQPTNADENPPGVGIKVSFRPRVAIVVGIFTMIFSLTFLLLMYAKFCHPSSVSSSSPAPSPMMPASLATAPAGAGTGSGEDADGVPKEVIESLPFFRFAALRGARKGMECSVCLAPFDDADLLRLLPRCRHAFHLDCVDRWLGASASCPLCRARVHADDATLGLKYAASARIEFGAGDDDDASAAAGSSGRDLLDIFVERAPSSRFGKEEASSPELDRHRHRIIVSDAVFKSRWSELNSADLIAIDTEMFRSLSSGRFYPSPEYGDRQLPAASPSATGEEVIIVDETEKKGLLQGTSRASSTAARMISSGVRSMSEIVSLPRLNRERLAEEENRRWLPIARRTARWFAGREKGEEDGSHVHVVAAHV